MMHTRQFGVEIEIANRDLNQMAKILREAGFNVYNQDDRSLSRGTQMLTGWGQGSAESFPEYTSAWRVIADGSVHRGCEVVSPILSGQDGLDQTRRIIKAMNKAGAKADKHCGLHVHVDARDLAPLELQNVARRYAAFEPVIDTFINPARRSNNNTYCKSTAEAVKAIDASMFFNNTDFIRKLRDRYVKLNLCAFLRHGTVEFRQLEGTTSWTKVCNWIEFCVSFVEASRIDKNLLTAHATQVAESYNRIPVDARKFLHRYEVDVYDFADIMNVGRSRVPQIIERMNQQLPGMFTKHPNYDDCWLVTIQRETNSFPAVTGTWSAGIPANVVSHLHNIAATHASS